jgi:hypothetical protein
MLRLFQKVYHYVDFSKMTNKELSRPEVIKELLRTPLYRHERKAKLNLYQGKRHITGLQTCFSEKK